VSGGLPGQRLLARLSIATSDDTVLRRVRQKPLLPPSVCPIRNLGVDDWAWRKGQDYGTILVNLDLHRVVDLLPDRAAESFSAWLQQHPEIVTISRDRCGLYAEGARLGAPQSQQIADRFHLVLNLSAAMERVLEERSRELILPPLQDAVDQPSATRGEVGTDVPELAPAQSTRSQLRRQHRLERYQQVLALYNSGQSQAAISRALGIERKTIRRWLRRGEFPERKRPQRRPPRVNEFADYLQQRWNEGCHNASRLYGEIRAKGYTGKRSMVARFVAGWRTTAKATSPNAPQRVAPKHAAILVTRAADQITDEQQRLLDRITIQCPDVIDLRRIALGLPPIHARYVGQPLTEDLARAGRIATAEPTRGCPQCDRGALPGEILQTAAIRAVPGSRKLATHGADWPLLHMNDQPEATPLSFNPIQHQNVGVGK
jgi:transposase